MGKLKFDATIERGENKMLEIKQSSTFENSRIYLADIFVEGFYIWLKYFSKNKTKLKKAFAHIFVLEHFYVAFKDGNSAGMAAVSDGNTLVVKLNKKELTKHLGFIIGRIAFYVLKKEFEVLGKQGLPRFPEVSFVSVLEKYRRQGIAEELINYVISHTTYEKYILEVADNNTPAVKLYEKLGFKEYFRVPVKNKKQTGFDFYIYLIKEK